MTGGDEHFSFSVYYYSLPAMEDINEFTVYLFSNSSSDVYKNSLSKFTCALSSPIYLGENHDYRVAVSEIGFPTAYDKSAFTTSRDCIQVNNFDYQQLYGAAEGKSLKTFIDILLRFSAVDVSIYDQIYFKSYLDPSVFFKTESLNKLFADDLLAENEVVVKKEFSLEINKLPKDQGLVNSSYFPPLSKETSNYSAYFASSYVRLRCGQSYTLKGILFACIRKILEKLQMERLSVEAQRELYDELRKSGTTYNQDKNATDEEKLSNQRDYIARAIKDQEQALNSLIHRFIENFVAVVETVRDVILASKKEIMKNRGESYVIIYSDACEESHIGNAKGKVLAVVQSEVGKTFYRYAELSYVPVEKTCLTSISFLLADLNGSPVFFAPSLNPTYIALKFKKF